MIKLSILHILGGTDIMCESFISKPQLLYIYIERDSRGE